MELYRRARGVLPSVFTFIRTVDEISPLEVDRGPIDWKSAPDGERRRNGQRYSFEARCAVAFAGSGSGQRDPRDAWGLGFKF